MVLDELDRRLLELLLEDARRSYRELARLADTTAPTAAARVRRMEELGIILGYHVRLDPQRFQGAGQAPGGQLDLAAQASQASVACHQCHKSTREPVWQRIGERRHPFCCTTCRDTYVRRYERFSQGNAARN